MRYSFDTLLDQATVAGTYYTESVDIRSQFGYSVCVTTVGAGTGSANLQASVDGETFVDVTDSSQSFSTAMSLFFNVSDAHYAYFRVTVIVATGTPDVVVKFFGKGF